MKIVLIFFLIISSFAFFSKGFSEGEIGDARCSVESVEFANSVQLREILGELLNTTYMRLFRVNMKNECNAQWKKPVSDTGTCSATPPVANIGLEGLDTSISSCSVLEEEGSELWKKTDDVDKSITKLEDTLTSLAATTLSCTKEDDDPSFWEDMCSEIGIDSKMEYINLQLNPKRNTGYDGSHLWQAIYEENCIKRAGSVENMCYEERVLYRLLSGMHAAINIQICYNYYPPEDGVRADWSPNPEKFVQLFKDFPERLKNLHFAYVVLLRALFKASPYLKDLNLDIGAEDDFKVKKLVNLLIETNILKSCNHIFSAFDETLLFREDNKAAFPKDLTIEGRLISLKQQFKGVFRNITKLLDCVSCQKCKLHAKLGLLGIGTALKILLCPNEKQLQLTCSSLAREEIVALFNTIGRWSEAIGNIQLLQKPR
jgi:hypothetical protein